MKEKCIIFWKKIYKDAAAVLCLIIAVTVLLMYFLDVNSSNISIPFSYSGGDDMSAYATVRYIQDTGWNLGTDKLAATEDYYDNRNEIIAGLHNTSVALTKFFYFVTGNVAVTVNLVYLATFYLIAIMSYIVLRALKVNTWISAEGGLVYAFLPFIFMRGISHIVLTGYYFVPFAILMSIWLCEDERFMRPDRQFFKYKRNIAGLVMAFFMASEGIGYWQIFSCIMLFVATVAGFVRRRADWKLAKRGFTAVCALIAGVVLNCIPEIIYIFQHIGESTEGRWRSVGDGERYSLKIMQLILPVNGHGSYTLQSLIDLYNDEMPLVNENCTAYLGLIGVLGFLLLLVWLFVSKKEENQLRQRLTVLSDLNIVTVLFSTIGGFGTMFFLVGIKLLRGLNRVSVYIAFIGITAICLICNELSAKIKNTVKYAAFTVGVTIVMLFAIWEQNPGTGFDYEGNRITWESDENFIAEVESVMDENDAIFQLPYVEYPENAGSNDMNCLAHYIGFIHSDKLRWSFGVEEGTESDIWYFDTASLPTAQMIQEVLNKGFDGIYINRDGYETADWKKLEAEIQSITGAEPIVSENSTLSFFKLR